MLLYSGETHLVMTGEDRHGLTAFECPSENVAPRLICQRLEDAIDTLFRQGTLYNHMVVQ
jgi:hypothetical protein